MRLHLGRELLELRFQQMVLGVAEAAEPEDRDLVEDFSFVGDAGREDDIEGGDAVGGDEEERVAEVVDVAYFSAAGEG